MTRVRSTLMLTAIVAPVAGAWMLAATPAVGATAARTGAKPPTAKTAWWSSTNLGHGLPALPTVGVSGSQLFVEGSNSLPSISLLGKAPSGAQAVTAVSYQLPKHTTAKSLSFKLAGTTPPAVSVQACRLTGSFRAGSDQAWSTVPSYSCAKVVNGTLSGSTVSFNGIGALAKGRRLSVLILPGPLDRVVLSAPTSKSLTITKLAAAVKGSHHRTGTSHATSPTTKAATHHVGTTTTSTSVNSDPATSLSSPIEPSSTGIGAGSAPSSSVTTGGSSVPAPALANPSTATKPTTALSGDATKLIPAAGWRRWAAFAVVMVEALLGFLVLRRRSAVAAAAGSDATEASPPGTTRGVGRFVSERTTQPMPL